MDHDEFNCECHETCALCCTSLPLTQLSSTSDGEWSFVCEVCMY
jgi:hypothetical protein